MNMRETEHHHHEGVEVPVQPAEYFLQEPGEEPQWVEVGTWCAVCGFDAGQVAIRMQLEAEMRLLTTETEAEWEE